MFFVIDKSKIVSYLVAICTVVILFVAAAGLNNVSDDNSVIHVQAEDEVIDKIYKNIVNGNEISNTITNTINNISNGINSINAQI